MTRSLIISRELLILTLSILLALHWCISWYIPRDGLMMREWPYTASNRDELGCTSPPTSRFPSALEMSLGLRPRDISRASGNLLVVGDVQPNTSLLSAVYVYNNHIYKVRECCLVFKPQGEQISARDSSTSPLYNSWFLILIQASY